MGNATAIPKENNARPAAVDFYGQSLTVVTASDQRLVAMKPICEGIGLSWHGQFERIRRDEVLSEAIRIIRTPSEGGEQSTACLPLEMLNGWLFGIDVSRCREEIRPALIQYKRECYTALAAYWGIGIAVRHESNTPGSLLGTTIGTDGFHCLAAVLDGKLRGFKGGAKRAAKNHVWQQVHRAFSVVSAEDIPAAQLDSARCFIAAYDVREGEFIEADKPKATERLDINFPVSLLTERRPGMLSDYNSKNDRLQVCLPDIDSRYESACEQVLFALNKAGYNVDAAFWEIRTYRNKMDAFGRALAQLDAVANGPQAYVIDKESARAVA